MTNDQPTDGRAGPDEGFLGLVVDGSLANGIEVRLDREASVEDVKVGAFVTIRGSGHQFFGVVTDVSLGSADPRLKHGSIDLADPFIFQALSGTVAYGAASVLPNLIMPLALGDPEEAPAAAKTIPAHFSRAYAASERDVAAVFGQEDDRHFNIGSPLDMEAKVCLDLDELVKRSIGVFGKSGTGKTFLTRLLLVGILQGSQASSLIFDMHSEYGWGGQDSDGRLFIKGLKQLFPSQVATFTLDEESSRRRGSTTDEVVRIGYGEIEPEDVEMLRETLNLSDVAAGAAYNLERKFGSGRWMKKFLDLDGRDAVFELANEIQVQPQALLALSSRLNRLKRFGFLTEDSGHDAANRIIEHLDRGKHVVLEFGRFGNDLSAYILVSNLLTPPHPRPLRHSQRGSRGRLRAGAQALSHSHRRSPQVPQSLHCVPDHLWHHCPGAAQVQRDPDGHRPAAQRHRRRGDEPVGHPANLPAGQRPGHRRGAVRRSRQPPAAGSTGPPGLQATGPGLRPRRTHARRNPNQALRPPDLRRVQPRPNPRPLPNPRPHRQPRNPRTTPRTRNSGAVLRPFGDRSNAEEVSDEVCLPSQNQARSHCRGVR